MNQFNGIVNQLTIIQILGQQKVKKKHLKQMIQQQYNSSGMLSAQSLQRKVSRLQIENMGLREELEKTVFKVRTLEQMQGKYQLLLGQTENENQRMKLNQVLLEKKLQQHIQQVLQQQAQQSLQSTRRLQQQHASTILQLKSQHSLTIHQHQLKYTQLKSSYQSLLAKSSQIDIFSFKLKKLQKLNLQLEQQLQAQKILSQQSKQRELMQLKMSLTKKMKMKYQQESEEYEQRIKDMSKRISQLELDNDLLMEKNRNIQLTQQSTNISKLKQLLSQRKSIQKSQLTKLQQSLDKANSSLRKMVQQKYQLQQKYLNREEQMKRHIKDIETELCMQQKSHTREIFTLQQKMRCIKDEQVNMLSSHMSELSRQFQQQRALWARLSQQHQQQLNLLQQQKTRQLTQTQHQKSRLKHKIKQLSKRLQQHQGKHEQGETQQMIASLKTMDEKQDTQGRYQNGIVFLERQLRKANISINQKNLQITKLLKQQTHLRQQTQQQITQWRQRYTNEKKQLMDRIFTVENQLRDCGDKLRNKEKELQKGQKQMTIQKIQLQKRIQTLQDINQELKKDYDRMLATNKAIQAEYRGERNRGVTAVGDVTYVKRMKWLQLQKQKNQLSILFREKEQQFKIIYEQQIDELRKQRDTFKQKATLLQDEKNRLQEDNEKLLQRLEKNKENVPNGVSGRKRAGEMEKKIASLNLQIALTKNLFENLQKAKSRLKSRDITVVSKERQQKMSQQNDQQQQESDQY